MSIIKAPYNFIPLSKEVVKPYWTKFINHDLPFEDAQSGTLEVILKAESPIFVKNGLKKSEEKSFFNDRKEQIKPHDFNSFENKYFIPGSSLKGMVRSVLEVMSFGRMDNRVNDDRYAVRDFYNNDIYNKTDISNNIRCGWLQKEKGVFYLYKSDRKPLRISHKAIDEKFSTDMADFFSVKGNLSQKDAKSAWFKYDKFKSVIHTGKFSSHMNDSGRERGYFDEDGQKGEIVFTGQPGERYYSDKKQKWEGKFFEFIFFSDHTEKVELSDDIVKNFYFAYYDHDKNSQKIDWKKRKKQIDKGEKIPVFFREEKKYKNDKKEVLDIGLSMLYKIVYKNSVKELIDKRQKEKGIDFAETLFGHVQKDNALKGRVHFGHAFAANETQVDRSVSEILGSPKASYYPNYIKQEVSNGRVNKYKTFMDNSAIIAGWKRYPIHSVNPKPKRISSEFKKVLTQFTPIKEGAEFKFKIRYHNLKKIELGALISALTFHETKNTFHSLGMAKPLGYGKVKLEVSGIENAQNYLCQFESFMNLSLKNENPEWTITPQIKELISMVSEQNNEGAGKLKYMSLMEFADAKKKNNREGLDRYSNLVNSSQTIKPLCTPEQIAEMKLLCENEERELNKFISVEEQVKANLANQEKELRELFDEEKENLLKAIKERQAEVKAAEKKEREEEEEKLRQQNRAKAKEKASAGLSVYLEDFNYESKKAFDVLKKIVARYLKDLKRTDGTLPEGDHSLMTDTLILIIDKIKGKNDRKKWTDTSKNKANLKKVADWIGEELTQEFYNKISK